jgi:hypothetical protein
MIGTFNRLTSDTLRMLRDDKSAKKIVSKTLKEKDLDGDDEDDEEEDEDENENAMREMLTNEYLEGDKNKSKHIFYYTVSCFFFCKYRYLLCLKISLKK